VHTSGVYEFRLNRAQRTKGRQFHQHLERHVIVTIVNKFPRAFT